MPPASAAQGTSTYADTGFGLSLLLGTDYEKRKYKLQQELQLDYKQHVAKKKELKNSETRPQHQGLSLPIDDNAAAQEKLRDERKREYNLFLQKQAQNKRLRRGLPPLMTTTEASDAVRISPPASPPLIRNIPTNDHPPPSEHPASRKDAATLTEVVDDGKRRRTWLLDHRGRQPWQIIRRKERYSSEEEFDSDSEKEFQFRRRRRRDRYTSEPEYKEAREQKANRAPQETKEVEDPGGNEQNNILSGTSDQQVPSRMRSAARSRPPTSRDEAEFATGLMIGVTEEPTASQLRKKQYKQELLKQIAEKQENKMRERKLELRIAATGATDPERKAKTSVLTRWDSQADRISHFGAVNQQNDSWKPTGIDLKKDPNPWTGNVKPIEDSEQNIPRGASHLDYTTAPSQLRGMTVPGSGARAEQSVPPLDYFTEDYHRDFSNMLGEVAGQRVAAAPPPVPPTVTDHYRTPYDAAYYYYGARNPLDPSLPYYQNGASEGQQQARSYHSPPVNLPPVRPSGLTEAPDGPRAAPMNVGEVLAERSKQGRESVLSYQEALRQQIKEREDHRRREKEEKERYDAKIEAELMAYNPWGRSGGGAPIKDQKGNLISNLTQMHRNNNESTRYHLSRTSGYTQSNMMRDCLSPGREPRVTPLQELPSVIEDGYRGELKKQMEQKRIQQERERERLRLEDEKEEKRLEEQRALMKREYEEEEQRKQKKAAHRQETKSWMHKVSVQQKKEERKESQEQKMEKLQEKTPESRREERNLFLYLQREPSPPIPTLQKKQRNPVVSRPPSVESQLSSRTDGSVSAPSCREVTAKAPQLQDGQQEVIRELSTLRTYLRNEQRKLEAQVGHSSSQNTPHSRSKGRVRLDTFQLSQRRAAETTRSPASAAARSNMQNIREFNQLKYRDTESREELRHMYPDPPTDALSLDIQQQALLREQQRKIRLMKREEEHGFWDQELNHIQPRNKSGHFSHRDDMLPSQSAFIDVFSGDVNEEQAQQRRQPSAGNRERRGAKGRRDYDVRTRGLTPGIREHQGTNRNLSSKDRPHKQHQAADHYRRQEEPSGDEADVLSLRSALGRRVSVDTVATEPWLRPGTSDAVKQSVCRERQRSNMEAPPLLTHRVT